MRTSRLGNESSASVRGARLQETIPFGKDLDRSGKRDRKTRMSASCAVASDEPERDMPE